MRGPCKTKAQVFEVYDTAVYILHAAKEETAVLLARNRSSERIAMALIRSTATVNISDLQGKMQGVESHRKIDLRARTVAS